MKVYSAFVIYKARTNAVIEGALAIEGVYTDLAPVVAQLLRLAAVVPLMEFDYPDAMAILDYNYMDGTPVIFDCGPDSGIMITRHIVVMT